MKCDVAIIGGGPAGATVGTLLKKYNPSLDVAIFERERFPRDHVGESLLPAVTNVLYEMGAWEKVEAANFPVKMGAKFRWGKLSDEDLYVFNFILSGEYTQVERPGKYRGQREVTAFQVDRSIFDKILLDHAAECGCRVHEEAKVVSIRSRDDHIDGLEAELDGERKTVEARYYIDASGGEGLIRRKMNVGVVSPTLLRNIAIWDYWQNAEWAEKVGVGGTYVYLLSIGFGWIWFIPLGPTRTSIGFVTSVEYFKKCGKTTEQLYLEALQTQPLVRRLTENAQREGKLRATKDWSFVADRLYGENWFLAGDACGFADPILSAGLSLAQMSGRQVACSILEIERGAEDAEWIKQEYNRSHRKGVSNHIRFADYWYSANEQFSELKEYCSEIAKGAGLSLDADAAFYWLATGGFSSERTGLAAAGGYRLAATKNYTSRFSGKPVSWAAFENNIFELNLEQAERTCVAEFENGQVTRLDCWRRGEDVWPLKLVYKFVYNALTREKEVQLLAERFPFEAQKDNVQFSRDLAMLCMEALEALVAEGWVKASYDPKVPRLNIGLA